MESYPPPPPPPPLRTQTNGLGIGGFVVSLVGILTCGVISPIALILSLVALRRQPRGFAIAGSVIGGIGTLMIAGIAVAWVTVPDLRNVFETSIAMAEAHTIIEANRGEGDALPSEDEGNELLEDLEDGWGNPLQYEVDGERFVVRSAGPDGEFGTEDDIPPSKESKR
jgi:hypothetical protein